MDIEWIEIVLCLFGGFLAGGMNTLAGFGSIVTLGIYTEILGLPLIMANGTNRVNVFAQTGLASYVFNKNGKLDLKNNKVYLVVIFIFAIIGVYIATSINNEQFKQLFKYLLLILLPIVLVNPKRWIIKSDNAHQPPKYIMIILCILLGLYGGFIQMGMGVLFLLVFVLIGKINIIESNALKVTIVFLYTAVLLYIFDRKGLVEWPLGLLMSIGQGIGAILTAKYASKSEKAEKVAYYILVVVLIMAVIKYWFF